MVFQPNSEKVHFPAVPAGVDTLQKVPESI